MKECPCRYCDKRSANCHGTCLEYKEWYKENQQLRRRRFLLNNSNRLADEDIINTHIKRKKRRQR